MPPYKQQNRMDAKTKKNGSDLTQEILFQNKKIYFLIMKGLMKRFILKAFAKNNLIESSQQKTFQVI